MWCTSADGAAQQRRLEEQPEIAEVVAPEARAELAQRQRAHHAELDPQAGPRGGRRRPITAARRARRR